MIHHVKRATRLFIFWSLIAGAVMLSLIRLVVNQIDHFTADLETVISSMVEAPCHIGETRINIYGVTPKLLLTDIDILQPDNSRRAIQIKEIRLGVDLWDAVRHWDLFSALRVTLMGARLSVKRKADGGISIVGLKSTDDQPLWLLQSGRYEMLQSEVSWQDEKRHAAVHQFSNVDIFIDNQMPDSLHRINVSLRLPSAFGDALQLSLLFKGNIFHSQSLNGQLYVRGHRINLAEMATGDLPLGLAVDSGRASFQLWSQWTHSKMTDLLGIVEAEQTELQLRNKAIQPLQRAVARFHWSRQRDGWRLAVKDVFLDTGEIKWAESDFSIWAAGDEREPVQKFALAMAHMDVAMLAKLLVQSNLLPNGHLQTLKKMAPRGEINDFFVFVDPRSNRFALNGGFKDIGFSAVERMPALDHLSGAIYGSERQGYVQLISRDAKIALPEWFKQPIGIETLQGKLQWSQAENHWLVAGRSIELDVPGIRTQNRIRLRIPKQAEQSVFMDWQTALVNPVAVRSTEQYLPTLIMDDALVDWLHQSLLSGEITGGKGLFYGNLNDFPFVERQGVFEVLLDVRKAAIAYDAEWPVAQAIDAEIMFFDESLAVQIERGRINGASIKHAVATIPSLIESRFVAVRGRVEGSVGQSIGFMQQSPLASQVAPVTETISAQGRNVIELQMQLPLLAELPAKVDGVARLDIARLTVLPLDLPISELQGDLRFNEQGVTGGQFDATALGFPIRAQIRPSDDNSIVTVNGRTDIAQLRQTFESRWWDYAQGEFGYDLQVTIPPAGRHAAKVNFTSDLGGVTLDLPIPLHKSPEQQAALSVELAFNDSKLMPVTVNYADRLKAVLQFDSEQQRLYSGDVLLGEGEPAMLRDRGIRLTVDTEQFSLSPWLALNDDERLKTADSLPVIKELVVDTAHFDWQNRDYGQLQLQLKRNNEQWQGHFSSQFGAGNMTYPERAVNDAKINLDMLYINLDRLIAFDFDSIGQQDISPLDFPLFKINSRQLLWHVVNLGALAIDTERLPDGMLFKRFMIKQKERSLSFFGSHWKLKNGRSETTATGTLKMDDLGVFLSEMDITYDIKETAARIDFSSYWTGAPFQVSLSDLEARVDVNLGAGRFLGVEPGIGRLLGVLDLGRILQRLQLDFSDVYAEGLSYDSIRGTFRLTGGYAKTNDLVIDAVPAKITITGSTGLVTRDYDQIITVIPKTSVAVPIAGTIVKGVASWVAQTVTGDQGDGFFISSQYALKGKWGEADIVPLHENDGLLQKAWLGITDFSWLSTKKRNKRE